MMENMAEIFGDLSRFHRLEEDEPGLYEEVMETLETVIDPELGIDIVNLGLIYDLFWDREGHLLVNMTLTTMGCPLQDIILDEVNRALAPLEAIKATNVRLVWVPAWSTKRLSRYARIALGIR